MSRSRRKTPIVSIVGRRVSEKCDKKQWHSSLRAKEKQRLRLLSLDTLDCYIPLTENDVSDLWAMSKDGKCWFGGAVYMQHTLLTDDYYVHWLNMLKRLLRK